MGRSTLDLNNMAKSRVCKCNSRNNSRICWEAFWGNLLWNPQRNRYCEQICKVSDIYINGGLSNKAPFNDIQTNVYGMKIIQGKKQMLQPEVQWRSQPQQWEFQNVEKAFECINVRTKWKFIFRMIKRFWNTKDTGHKWTVFIKRSVAGTKRWQVWIPYLIFWQVISWQEQSFCRFDHLTWIYSSAKKMVWMWEDFDGVITLILMAGANGLINYIPSDPCWIKWKISVKCS